MANLSGAENSEYEQRKKDCENNSNNIKKFYLSYKSMVDRQEEKDNSER